MNVRRFRALHVAGATYAEIGRKCGVDWRTVRKYLAEDATSVPPPAGPPRVGSQPKVITPCDDVNGPIIVTGSDPHGLDGDGDGVACES